MEQTQIKKEVKLHLEDILRECKGRKGLNFEFLKQIEHNVFEIAEHIGIKAEDLTE